MAAVKVTCPDCGLSLNPAKAPQPGKKVKCPRCANIFKVPGPDDIQTIPPRPPAKKPNPAIQKAAPAKAAPSKAAAPSQAPPPKPAPAEQQDDEAGIYGFKMSPEEEAKQEEEKPEIE